MRYKNTNKMSDVRIMKKIQIYITCKFTGVAKWNLFHCLSCWGAPSLDPTLIFSESQVLLSHLWGLKKIKIKIKEDRRKKRYKRRERRSRTRKQEREEEGVKRKKSNNKIIIKNYFKMGEKKKKPSLLASNCPWQFCWCFWLQPDSGGLTQLFSVPDQGSLWTHRFRHSLSSRL